MVSVPMVTPLGHLVGVLNVHTRLRREFTAADMELLRSVAGLVAGAIENARLHRRLAEREEALERFAERTVEWQEREQPAVWPGEIHDGISQRIVSLFFHLSAAADAIPGEPEVAAEQVAPAPGAGRRRAGRDPLRDRRAAPADTRRPRAGRQPGEPGPLVPATRRAGRRATCRMPSTSRPPYTVPHRRRCRTWSSMRTPATSGSGLSFSGTRWCWRWPMTAPGSIRPPSAAPMVGRPLRPERRWRASRPASAWPPCGSGPTCSAGSWS